MRALRADRPGAQRGLGDDGPGAPDPAAPAPLQRLPSHGPRAARLQAAPSVPVLADLRPHQPQARHRRAVPPSPGVGPRHRHRARQRRRGRSCRDRRRRARSLPRRRAASEPSASSPADVPDLGGDKPARVRATHDRRAPQGAPTRSATRSARATGRHQGRVVVHSRDRRPAPKPKASTARARRRAGQEGSSTPRVRLREPGARCQHGGAVSNHRHVQPHHRRRPSRRPRRSAPPSRSSCRDVPPESRPDRPLLLRRRLDDAAPLVPPSRAVRPVRRPVDDARARASGRDLRRGELLVRLTRTQRQRVHATSSTTRA